MFRMCNNSILRMQRRPLYLLIWKAVLPFSKTFLHHVYPLWELSDFLVQSCILCKILALFVNFSVTNSWSWFNQFCSVFQNHSRIKKCKIFKCWLQYSNSGNGQTIFKLKNVSDFLETLETCILKMVYPDSLSISESDHRWLSCLIISVSILLGSLSAHVMGIDWP